MSQAPHRPVTRFSLGAKLAVATVVVLLVVSGVVYGVLTRAVRRTLLDDKAKTAALVADLFAASAVAPLDFGDDKDVAHELQNLRVDPDISYAGVWRGGDAAPVASFGDLGSTPLPARSATQASSSRTLDAFIEVARQIARPDGTVVGQAVLRFSLAAEQAAISRAQTGIFYGTLFTLALTAFLIVAITRLQIVRPLARLVGATERLAAGEHVVRVAVDSHDEVADLAAAFNAMSTAIVDREESLADALAQLRELFDHMRQGIVVFGADGLARASPSRQAGVILGAHIAGRPVVDILYPDAPVDGPERQAFEEWVACAFDVPPAAWDDAASLAPPRVERTRDGKRQWLELAWSPVVKADRVDRVMLLATDVTRERELERDRDAREEAHAREMAVMWRLLAGGGQVFATFLDSATTRIEGALRVLRGSPLGREELRSVLMDVHTLRGEARTFELADLASVCEGIERTLGPPETTFDAASKARAIAAVESARATVDRARDLFVTASPIGPAVLDQMTVRRSDVTELARHVPSFPPAARRLFDALSSRPFGECVTGLEAAAARWAAENDKQVRVIVSGRDTRVPSQIARALAAALPHLVKNAIAHGLETPAARRAANKDPVGTIRIAAKDAPLAISVIDDGAGLDEAAVRARGKALGLAEASAALLVMTPGLSTFQAPTEVAGLGVGLAAASRDLDGVGCALSIDSKPGQGVTVSMFARTEV